MFKRILLCVGALLWVGQAQAADNYSATAGSGLTFAAKSVGGILFPWSIPSDSTGAAFGVTGNPFFVTSTVLGTAANQSTINTSLGTINTTLGTPMQASGGTVTAISGTATNLKSQVSVASGGIASGAVASGAVASGAVASGAFASGSLASGSMVDLLTFQGTKAAGTAAANSLLVGGVYNSSPLTLTTGQQSSLQFDANGYVKMNVAAGGAGGGAVYGPTANGSAAANPPVLMGGTATGGATGNVANAEIVAGGSAGLTDPALAVQDAQVLAAVKGPIAGVSGSAQSSSNPMGWVNINQTTPGTTNGVVTTGSTIDPCQNQVATILPFTIPTNTTTNVLTGTSAKKIYVCYLYMQTGLANNVAVIEATTATSCVTSQKALVGGVTAATGLINAANSGQAMGNGGYSVMQTTVANNDICIITSASGPLSGVMKYVVQ